MLQPISWREFRSPFEHCPVPILSGLQSPCTGPGGHLLAASVWPLQEVLFHSITGLKLQAFWEDVMPGEGASTLEEEANVLLQYI